MVKIRIVKKYFDVELNKNVEPKIELEVSDERAKKLCSMGLAEILHIDKFSKKKNG